MAWNKYGEKNFIFEIIEDCDITILENRELYWIQYYKSYENNLGYNYVIGTKDKRIDTLIKNRNKLKEYRTEEYHKRNSKRHLLLKENVKDIKILLSKGKTVDEVSNLLHINKSLIYPIKSTNKWKNILPELNEKIMSFKNIGNRALTKDEVLKIKRALLETESTGIYEVLAQQYNVSKTAIYNIKKIITYKHIGEELNDKLKEKIYINDSISGSLPEEKVLQIESMLKEKIPVKTIVDLLGVSDSTIWNIKNNKYRIKRSL